jgi:hypothetical protein
VLARSDEDHLLKWSLSDLSAEPQYAGVIFDKNSRWVVEDLTHEVVGGKLIEGEPKRVSGSQPIKEIPEEGISYEDFDEFFVEVEKIFVTDQNNHLLEWQIVWKNEEIELEDGTKSSKRIKEDWQVTDLTEVCQYVGEQYSTPPKPKCTKEEYQEKEDPHYRGPCNNCTKEELDKKKTVPNYTCVKNR